MISSSARKRPRFYRLQWRGAPTPFLITGYGRSVKTRAEGLTVNFLPETPGTADERSPSLSPSADPHRARPPRARVPVPHGASLGREAPPAPDPLERSEASTAWGCQGLTGGSMRRDAIRRGLDPPPLPVLPSTRALPEQKRTGRARAGPHKHRKTTGACASGVNPLGAS